MKFPVVQLRWVDAQSIDGWEPLSEVLATPPTEVRTVGFLVGETDVAFFIANSIHDEEAACTMQVPKCCVLERTDL
jgi:hypothetical protein